ncbi:MAG: T9SS type A sorting domain-containing protein [Cytophagales bacterium]|nr:T9SS type A sorting domain-containing protein [Cytophagales bacterium]
MKKSILSVVVLIIISLTCFAQPGTWTNQTPYGSRSGLRETDVAFSPFDSKVYTSRTDSWNYPNNKGHVEYHAPGPVSVTGGFFNLNYSSKTKINVDAATGDLYFTSMIGSTAATRGVFTYKYSSGAWSPMGQGHVVTSSGFSYNTFDHKIASNGMHYAVVYDNGAQLFLYTNSGANWGQLTGFSMLMNNNIVMATAANGDVYFATDFGTVASSAIKIKKFNGTTFTDLPDAGNHRMGTLSLAINSSNQPIVAFPASTGGNNFVVREYNGSAWNTIAAVAATTTTGILDKGLAVDASNNVYFSFGWDNTASSFTRVYQINSARTLVSQMGSNIPNEYYGGNVIVTPSNVYVQTDNQVIALYRFVPVAPTLTNVRVVPPLFNNPSENIISVIGSNISSSVTVTLNGVGLSTTFVGSSLALATVPPMFAGTNATFTASNMGSNVSNQITNSGIIYAVPAITAAGFWLPFDFVVPNPPMIITLVGSTFTPNARLTISGVVLTTSSFISSNLLIFTLPGNVLTTTSPISRVQNSFTTVTSPVNLPSTSVGVYFNIDYAFLSDPLMPGATNIAGTITGSGFVPGMQSSLAGSTVTSPVLILNPTTGVFTITSVIGNVNDPFVVFKYPGQLPASAANTPIVFNIPNLSITGGFLLNPLTTGVQNYVTLTGGGFAHPGLTNTTSGLSVNPVRLTGFDRISFTVTSAMVTNSDEILFELQNPFKSVLTVSSTSLHVVNLPVITSAGFAIPESIVLPNNEMVATLAGGNFAAANIGLTIGGVVLTQYQVVNANLVLFTIPGSFLTTSTPGVTVQNKPNLPIYNATLIGNRLFQTVTLNPIGTRTFGGSSFALGGTTTSALPLVFISSNPTIISITGTTAHILSVGVVTITATQAGNAMYNPAKAVEEVMVVKANQAITGFSANLGTIAIGSPNVTLLGVASSGLPITYTSSDNAVAEVQAGNQLSIVGIGIVTITATQVGNANYNAAPTLQGVLSVQNLLTQTVVFQPIGVKTFGGASFIINATATSGLPVTTITSANTAIISVVGTTGYIMGAGIVNIIGTQAGDGTYATGVGIEVVTVTKAPQVITGVPSDLGNVAITSGSIVLNGLSSVGLPVSYTTSNSAVAVAIGNVISFTGIGVVTITSSQVGNSNYAAAADIFSTLNVQNLLPQTITFAPVGSKTFGGANFTITATATSGLTVTLTSSNTSIISITGTTARIMGAGMVTIVGTQAGNGTYEAGVGYEIVTIEKAAQIVTFPSVANRDFVSSFTFTPATATSGLPITYTTSDVFATIFTTAGPVFNVSLTGAGTFTVTASQVGNANYLPSEALRVVTINKINQSLTGVPVGLLKPLGSTETMSNITATSGLPISLLSSNTAVATTTGNSISYLTRGVTTITVNQLGNSIYNSVSQNYVVSVSGGIQSIIGANVTFPGNGTMYIMQGSAVYTFTGVSSAGLPLTFRSEDNTVGSFISDNVFSATGIGQTRIFASQAGNSFYDPAPEQLLQYVFVLPNPHTLTGYNTTLSGVKTVRIFDLVTLSSGITTDMRINSSNNAISSVMGDSIRFYNIGTTIITVSHSGSYLYQPSNMLQIEVVVPKANQYLKLTPSGVYRAIDLVVVKVESVVGQNLFTVRGVDFFGKPIQSTNVYTKTSGINPLNAYGQNNIEQYANGITAGIYNLQNVNVVTVTATFLGNNVYNPAYATEVYTVISTPVTYSFDASTPLTLTGLSGEIPIKIYSSEPAGAVLSKLTINNASIAGIYRYGVAKKDDAFSFDECQYVISKSRMGYKIYQQMVEPVAIIDNPIYQNIGDLVPSYCQSTIQGHNLTITPYRTGVLTLTCSMTTNTGMTASTITHTINILPTPTKFVVNDKIINYKNDTITIYGMNNIRVSPYDNAFGVTLVPQSSAPGDFSISIPYGPTVTSSNMAVLSVSPSLIYGRVGDMNVTPMNTGMATITVSSIGQFEPNALFSKPLVNYKILTVVVKKPKSNIQISFNHQNISTYSVLMPAIDFGFTASHVVGGVPQSLAISSIVSSNPTIATVQADGKIKFISAGVVTITAITADNIHSSGNRYNKVITILPGKIPQTILVSTNYNPNVPGDWKYGPMNLKIPKILSQPGLDEEFDWIILSKILSEFTNGIKKPKLGVQVYCDENSGNITNNPDQAINLPGSINSKSPIYSKKDLLNARFYVREVLGRPDSTLCNIMAVSTYNRFLENFSLSDSAIVRPPVDLYFATSVFEPALKIAAGTGKAEKNYAVNNYNYSVITITGYSPGNAYVESAVGYAFVYPRNSLQVTLAGLTFEDTTFTNRYADQSSQYIKLNPSQSNIISIVGVSQFITGFDPVTNTYTFEDLNSKLQITTNFIVNTLTNRYIELAPNHPSGRFYISIVAPSVPNFGQKSWSFRVSKDINFSVNATITNLDGSVTPVTEADYKISAGIIGNISKSDLPFGTFDYASQRNTRKELVTFKRTGFNSFSISGYNEELATDDRLVALAFLCYPTKPAYQQYGIKIKPSLSAAYRLDYKPAKTFKTFMPGSITSDVIDVNFIMSEQNGNSKIKGFVIEKLEAKGNGRSESANGSLPGLPVFVINTNTQQVEGFAYTDDEGNYTISGLRTLTPYQLYFDSTGTNTDQATGSFELYPGIETNFKSVLLDGNAFYSAQEMNDMTITGLNTEVASSKFKVYPNPASDVVNLESDLNEWCTITVVDLKGQTHKKMTYKFEKGKTLKFNTEELTNGLYLLDINYYKGREVKKLKIEK